MHYCRFVHESLAVEKEYRELLEDRLYRFFVSGEPDGAPGPPASGEHAAVISVLDRLCRTAAVEAYTRGNSDLSERAAHDAVAWCANRLHQSRHDDTIQDLDGVGKLLEVDPRRMSAEDALAAAKAWLAATSRLGESSAELQFLNRQVADLAHHRGRAGADREASVPLYAARAVAAAVRLEARRLIEARRQSILSAVFAETFPAFVTELTDLLPRLAETQRRLEDFFGAPGRLWDRELREWEEVPWSDLSRIAAALEQEPSIRRLARLLGRMHERGVGAEPELVPVSHVSTDSVATGRSEVDGVAAGSDLSSLTDQELALLADTETSALFDKRFADSRLLIRSYKTREDVHTEHVRWETRGRGRPVEAGPIILCVDTSGSMAGDPERVAKLLTLAITRSALAEGRQCFLVFFSTEITCIEVTNLADSIDSLVAYLTGSVRGGTDVAPALRRATDLLRTESYQNADVLVVSDFRIPKIPGAVRRLVNEAQTENSTRFHSLTITDKPVRDTFFLFDYRWHYDVSNPLQPGIADDAFRLLG